MQMADVAEALQPVEEAETAAATVAKNEVIEKWTFFLRVIETVVVAEGRLRDSGDGGGRGDG